MLLSGVVLPLTKLEIPWIVTLNKDPRRLLRLFGKCFLNGFLALVLAFASKGFVAFAAL